VRVGVHDGARRARGGASGLIRRGSAPRGIGIGIGVGIGLGLRYKGSVPSSPLIAPSLLSCDLSRIGAEIAAVEAAGADWIHVDVMDGRFVPNLTFGPPVVAAMKRAATVPLDCHLMIVEPERYVGAFAEAGAATITVHEEASLHLHRTLQQIRAAGCSPGVALNPHSPESALDYALDLVDLVLVMTVNPGFGGQSFIESCLPKVERLAQTLARRGLRARLEVDGGVTEATAGRLCSAGANVLVAGTAVFGQADYRAAIEGLRASGARGSNAQDAGRQPVQR
jgi:ribulose-phosphate 3-epimerase